ncbi:hypothetical protein JRQ81_016051 [Phrynocephalus forsythii]|uniref:Uncharacterized protein n=1 Tax=Phrynocephalus forsythii TaxID=171643 RepID=A0A9Q0XXQ7_9SAUR|nr:hypothetical protein JRQ81_016051 [Phrynocephalus forsythii]
MYAPLLHSVGPARARVRPPARLPVKPVIESSSSLAHHHHSAGAAGQRAQESARGSPKVRGPPLESAGIYDNTK